MHVGHTHCNENLFLNALLVVRVKHLDKNLTFAYHLITSANLFRSKVYRGDLPGLKNVNNSKERPDS
jgi:hypothetical protein